MLEKYFVEIYDKFKLNFYRKIFNRFENREATLTAVETFCVQAIHALKSPTIVEFAEFVRISPANATYKINSLVKKGYVNKVPSETDRRQIQLKVSDKFMAYYGLTEDYVRVVVGRLKDCFPPEDIAKFESMLEVMSTTLMNEIVLKA